MPQLFDHETLELLADPTTVRVIATVAADGTPTVSVSHHLELFEEGRLVHLELLESSETSRNLLHALWFDHKVAFVLRSVDGRSRVIRGRPVKTHISGPIFRRYYESIRKQLGDAGLAAVWLIEPEEIHDDTYENRRKIEKERYPFHLHLDQLALKGD